MEQSKRIAEIMAKYFQILEGRKGEREYAFLARKTIGVTLPDGKRQFAVPDIPDADIVALREAGFPVKQVTPKPAPNPFE